MPALDSADPLSVLNVIALSPPTPPPPLNIPKQPSYPPDSPCPKPPLTRGRVAVIGPNGAGKSTMIKACPLVERLSTTGDVPLKGLVVVGFRVLKGSGRDVEGFRVLWVGDVSGFLE